MPYDPAGRRKRGRETSGLSKARIDAIALSEAGTAISTCSVTVNATSSQPTSSGCSSATL
jgi:hypothetical protein